jgi:hypothetical protein
MAARQSEFITQALAELRKRRPCRSCGRPFRPERIDALTCSETCRWRRSHGQPDYIDSLNTEQAVHEARQFHARIEYLLKEVQAHTAAERERRRERRANEELGQDLGRVVWDITVLEFLKRPNSTRESLIAAVLSDLPGCPPQFAPAMVDKVLRIREAGRRLVFSLRAAHSYTREELVDAVRQLTGDESIAIAIVDGALGDM